MSACPAGWKLPNNDDWDNLMTAVGGSSTAGTKLKSRTGWFTGSGYIAGTDDYGFSALPGGGRWLDGNFDYVGDFGHWWSASEDNESYADCRRMFFHHEYVPANTRNKANGFSVRCVRD